MPSRNFDKLTSELQRTRKKSQHHRRMAQNLKEDKAELVLKVSDLETRLGEMNIRGRRIEGEGGKGSHVDQPAKSQRSVLEILNDIQAIRQMQHAYLGK